MVQHSKPLRDIALAPLSPASRALEIAPFYEPFLSKSMCEVQYTDYIDTEELLEKARNNPHFTDDDVTHVDFVWRPGAPLSQCVSSSEPYDYIVASHVMEHVPNPVGWLNELLSVLRDGGHLALFLPDKRRSIDFFRNATDFGQMVQWWIEQPDVPTASQILDFMTLSFVNTPANELVWEDQDAPREPLTRVYEDAKAIDTAIYCHNEGYYPDIHCTVWQSDTCGRIFQRLVDEGLLNVGVVSLAPDESGLEFLLLLKKLGEPARRPPERRKPKAAETSGDDGFKASVEHQLKILRHDMTFLIQMVAELGAPKAGG